MSNTTASPKQAITSVLGAITNVATSVSSVFDTMSAGVGMANRYVQDASEKQGIASDYQMADYEEHLVAQVSIERTRMNREITRFLDQDPANAAEFAEVQANLREAVAKRRAKRNGTSRGAFGQPLDA